MYMYGYVHPIFGYLGSLILMVSSGNLTSQISPKMDPCIGCTLYFGILGHYFGMLGLSTSKIPKNNGPHTRHFGILGLSASKIPKTMDPGLSILGYWAMMFCHCGSAGKSAGCLQELQVRCHTSPKQSGNLPCRVRELLRRAPLVHEPFLIVPKGWRCLIGLERARAPLSPYSGIVTVKGD